MHHPHASFLSHISFTTFAVGVVIALVVVALAATAWRPPPAWLRRLRTCILDGALLAVITVVLAYRFRHAQLAAHAPHHRLAPLLWEAFGGITVTAGLVFFIVASIAAGPAARRSSRYGYGYRPSRLGPRRR